MDAIAREQWDGATSDDRRFSRPLNPDRVRGLVLHYPGTGPNTYARLTVAEVARLLRGYRDYHRRARRWPDIGYCLAVDGSGRLYEAAGFKVAAHSATPSFPSGNRVYVGLLCVIGDDEPMTPAMQATIVQVQTDLRAGRVPFHGWRPLPGMTELLHHRLVRGATTQCAGDVIDSMIRRGQLAASRDDVRPPITPPRPTPVTGRPTPGTVRVQRILRGAGYDPGPVDGVYGPRTAAAVREYQSEQVWPRLVADGKWGPITDGHAVWTAELQRTLNRWRTSLPRLRVDSDYGDLTAARVTEWQRRNRGGAYPWRARIDGQAGPLTTNGLGMRSHP